MRLFILLVLAILAVSVNGRIEHTFDHFSIRKSGDQACFVYEGGTTADATQTNLGKCETGCGGSVIVEQAKRSQEYIFRQYNSTDCTGSATTEAGFKCPNPSINPIKVSNTDYTIKCGTNPKSKVDEEDAEDTIDNTEQTDPKLNGPKSKPKSHDSNEITGFSDEEDQSSNSKPKSPKSPKSDQDSTATEEEANTKDDGNSATSNIASLSIVLISLVASLVL